MRRQSRISLGPGAASLILIVVILSMSVLGILSLLHSRNDARLSERSAQVIRSVYELNEQGERSLAALDAVLARQAGEAGEAGEEAYLQAVSDNLPQGMRLAGDLVSWTETDGLRTLDCAVQVLPPGSGSRFQWKTHRLTAVTEDIWD